MSRLPKAVKIGAMKQTPAHSEAKGAPVGDRRAAPPGGSARAAGFDADYWLDHCEGYRVDGAHGRIGFVQEVRSSGDADRRLLAVRAGRLGRRLLLFRATDVDFLVPRAERIWLSSSAELVDSVPLHESAGEHAPPATPATTAPRRRRAITAA